MAKAEYATFARVLKEAKNIIALTGAGVSQESGIAVFRGPGGLWRTYRATDLASPTAFRANPSLVWEFYNWRREVAFRAQPNKAHTALAEYEKLCRERGANLTVITQNVDGLHQRAGSENVLELHGALRKVICTKCKNIATNINHPVCEALRGRGNPDPSIKDPMIEKSDLPKCSKCSSLLRPYIVWFGENLDPAVMSKAQNLAETCDLCIVVGTSGTVYPAAAFAPQVASRGKPVAEFNIDEYPASDEFKFYFSGPCGTTLPKALGVIND